MTIRTSPWPAGVPCWADLTVPDLEAAKAFYAEVLGWKFQQFGEEFGNYAIAQVRDAAAAGIGPQPHPDLPAAWTLYFASDDVEATASAVTEHGGALLLSPGDVGPLGRMCIAADPTGAVFGVWQSGRHIGAEIANEAGGLMWEDLRSTDPDAARAFYRAVFDHRTEPLADAGPDYHTFSLADEPFPLGGMGGMMGAEGAPSHWLVYFAVPDAAGAVQLVEKLGGTVLSRDMDTPYGRMAVIADPAGATLSIIQPPDGAPMPDRAG